MSHLQHLAINKDGFVFDPTTGESFTVNGTGLVILEGMMAGNATEDIVEDIIDRFDVTPAEVQRDLMDFIDRLRTFRLT
jgi:hypothetical protein